MTEQQVIDFQFRGQHIPVHMVRSVLDYFNNWSSPRRLSEIASEKRISWELSRNADRH